MTEKGIKKSAHTASYDAKFPLKKMHSDVTRSLEQLEHPGVKHQTASYKKTGAHTVAAHKAGSELKKK